MAQVINVKKFHLRRLGYDDLSHWLKSSSNHMYIGRSMVQYVEGAVGSKWANPFKVDKCGRQGAIEQYEEYVRSTPHLYDNIEELEGKILGCWCHPDPCHGDVLVKILEEKALIGNKHAPMAEDHVKKPEPVRFRWQKKGTD